jgi:hypothetical protein
MTNVTQAQPTSFLTQLPSLIQPWEPKGFTSHCTKSSIVIAAIIHTKKRKKPTVRSSVVMLTGDGICNWENA